VHAVQGERWVLRVWRLLIDVLAPYCALAGSIALALWQLPESHIAQIVLIAIGVVLTLIGSAALLLTWPTRGALLRALRVVVPHLVEQRSATAIRGAALLQALLDELDLRGRDQRASVFTRGPDGMWILVARFSDNGEYRQPGRTRYAPDEGLVQRTWNNEETLFNELPATRSAWETAVARKFKLSPEDVRKLRMQSRSYACIRLEHSHGITYDSVGVLIVESTKANGLTGSHMDTMRVHWTRGLLALECTDKSDLDQVLVKLPEDVVQASSNPTP
jgi:hypothetical protein